MSSAELPCAAGPETLTDGFKNYQRHIMSNSPSSAAREEVPRIMECSRSGPLRLRASKRAATTLSDKQMSYKSRCKADSTPNQIQSYRFHCTLKQIHGKLPTYVFLRGVQEQFAQKSGRSLGVQTFPQRASSLNILSISVPSWKSCNEANIY